MDYKRFNELSNKILELVKRRNHVSFVEIENMLKREGVEVSGEYTYMLPPVENVVMWADMSEVFVDLVLDFKKRNDLDIRIMPCSDLVYIADGQCLNAEVLTDEHDLRKIAKAKKKKIYWGPAVFVYDKNWRIRENVSVDCKTLDDIERDKTAKLKK